MNFISITVIYFKKDKENIYQCMELLDPIVKIDLIVTLKKDLNNGNTQY